MQPIRVYVGLQSAPTAQARAQLAVQELERAAKLPGLRALNIGEHINGKNLHEKEFWPIYERAEALNLPIFTHNLYPTDGQRLKDFFMINTLGNLSEDGIAAVSLICGGVMDAFPKLDVYLPHAGGTFPHLIGRMDHGTTVRAECKHMTKPPSSYLRRFHYDTITHSDSILLNLIRQVGADRVVMGSDCPADMSYTQPVAVIERMKDLQAGERELIVSGNAARLLKVA